MRKTLTFVFIGLAMTLPAFAHASIFNDLVGAVRDLQRQVVTLVSNKIELNIAPAKIGTEENLLSYASSTLGFRVQYPRDWATTSVFSVAPEYRDSVVFIRSGREEFLKKIIRPSSTVLFLTVQDSAIFFKPEDDMYSNPGKYAGLISTSTKEVGSSTVLYILHSPKTDRNKVAGGSTEKYVFQNASSTIIAEANYVSDVPGGATKLAFDKMLQSFKFIAGSVSVGTSTATSTLAGVNASTTTASASSSAQTAGTILSH